MPTITDRTIADDQAPDSRSSPRPQHMRCHMMIRRTASRPWNVTQIAASRLIASAVMSIRSRSCRITCLPRRARRGCVRYSSTAADRAEHDGERQLNPDRDEHDRIDACTNRSAMPSWSKWTARTGGSSGRAPDDVAGCARISPRSSSRRRAASARWADRSLVIRWSSHRSAASLPRPPDDRRPRRSGARATSRPPPSRHAGPARRDSDVTPPLGDAARHDQLEVIEVGGHVEREAVARNPARDAHADRTQLIGADPRARQALRSGPPGRPKSAAARIMTSSRSRTYLCTSQRSGRRSRIG